MNKEPALLDYIHVAANRSAGVRLEARLHGGNIAYALTTLEARNMAGALAHLANGTEDDYFSITKTLTVISDPAAKGLYLEMYFREYRIELPLDKRGALQISAGLERSASAYEAAVLL